MDGIPSFSELSVEQQACVRGKGRVIRFVVPRSRGFPHGRALGCSVISNGRSDYEA